MKQTKTIVHRPVETDLAVSFSAFAPILQRVYAARGLDSAKTLDHSLKHLLPLDTLGGLDRAADILYQAFRERQRILIVGDFDADGATSSALCVHALSRMGAHDVQYLVPNRFEFGYGLTPEIVEVAARRNPDLIVTVDNGISSVEGVQAAKDHGIAVLITDHHLVGKVLPLADGIVNPNLPNDPFPSKNLAGVGVAFYVLLALRARLRKEHWFANENISDPNLAEYLDLVALGTVADVVPLDYNNRILVSQGLARIRAGQCRPGISALLQIAKRNPARIVASDMGFAVAPRLNAAGRLEDMSLGIECLLASNSDAAFSLAQRLDELNHERRSIEANMQEQALANLQALQLQEDELPTGLCLYDEAWHQGVIGILASRIKEKYHRPVIAFAPVSATEMKGSARSIPGVHVRDALDAVATRNPGLVLHFGGHAMAAGLSIRKENYNAFRTAFDEEIYRHVTQEDLSGVIQSDGELNQTELNLDTAQLIRDGGPWGQGFPEPTFDGIFEVEKHRIVGEKHLKLELRVPGDSRCIDAIAFGQSDRQDQLENGKARIAYRLDVNEYRGFQKPQLIVEYLEAAE